MTFFADCSHSSAVLFLSSSQYLALSLPVPALLLCHNLWVAREESRAAAAMSNVNNAQHKQTSRLDALAARSLVRSLTRSLVRYARYVFALPLSLSPPLGNNSTCLLGVVSLLALPAFAVRLFNCSAKPPFVCIASRSFDRTRRVASRGGRFARVKSRSAAPCCCCLRQAGDEG